MQEQRFNPHSVCAQNTDTEEFRGFHHRGLCDTCPQVGDDRRLGGVPGRYLTTLNRSGSSAIQVNNRFSQKPLAVNILQAQAWQALNSARLKQGNLDLVPQ